MYSTCILDILCSIFHISYSLFTSPVFYPYSIDYPLFNPASSMLCLSIYIRIYVIYVYPSTCLYLPLYHDVWIYVCIYHSLCVCAYVYVYISIRACMCVSVCAYVHVHVYAYFCLYIYLCVHLHVRVRVCMCICMWIYVLNLHIRTYMYIYVYICMYICITFLSPYLQDGGKATVLA